tara:strand:+ start:503 stop:862 length:360 start_codon:yes stop_codon:yes gene_type:complete
MDVISVLFINNDMGGYAKRLDIEANMKISDFFSKTMKELQVDTAVDIEGVNGGFADDSLNENDGFGPDEVTSEDSLGMDPCNINPSNYVIRVNRQPVTEDQVLQDGDKITVTPTKIEGA